MPCRPPSSCAVSEGFGDGGVVEVNQLTPLHGTDAQAADGHTLQFGHVETDLREHLADLAVFPLGDDDFVPIVLVRGIGAFDFFDGLGGHAATDDAHASQEFLNLIGAGLAAAATQTLVSPNSALPMVGASGAISGVMGAYIVLYPRVRVHMLIFLGFFITRAVVPAYVMLGYWFLLQIVGGLPSLGDESGGVAFWAHAGGFLAGAVLVLVFRDDDLVARHRALARYV